MTLKTKLTLNVLIILVTVGAVGLTSILGLGFVKGKLLYLTERSTPYQTRTIELDRAIQGTTAELVKVSASQTEAELAAYRKEAERALAEVRSAQARLGELGADASGDTAAELGQIAGEVFRVSQARLAAEQAAGQANQAIGASLAEASARLRALDQRIRGLQRARSTSLAASFEGTRTITARLRGIESLKDHLKDLQLALADLQRAADKKAILIARGKARTALGKAQQNPQVVESKALQGDLKALADGLEEAARILAAGEDRARAEALARGASEKLSAVQLAVEQDALGAGERYEAENRTQSEVFAAASAATDILTANSELLALGLGIEGLSTRLFTLKSEAAIAPVEAELQRAFERMGPLQKSLEAGLQRNRAVAEVQLLRQAQVATNGVRALLFESDGVVAKIRHVSRMGQQAAQATEKLRQIVLRQGAQTRQTVSTARDEQEKAISAVTGMVKLGTSLVAGISLAAVILGVVYGTWVYRTAAKPLNSLVQVANTVAGGELAVSIPQGGKDEIGHVLDAVRKMVDNLKDVVGKLRASTENLVASAGRLSGTALALAEGEQSELQRIEHSAAAIGEMSQANGDVSRNAANTAHAAQRMKSTALDSRQMMTESVTKLSSFGNTVKDSADKVEQLSRKSEEIDGIITLIKDIADQTNLLALNAAIEAARAGEQGRGFAVVADSVRTLAEETGQAANQIGVSVGAMRREMVGTTAAILGERDEVERVIADVTRGIGSIDEIVELVGQVAEMIDNIAAATEQQSAASAELAEDMDQVLGIIRQLTQSADQVKGAADDMSELAGRLNAASSWFKTS
jgi:methyl-accepting chemotaxis protein